MDIQNGQEYKGFIKDYYDDFSGNWDDRFKGTKASKYYFRRRLEKLEEHVGTDFETILEIACGTGYHLMRLMKGGRRGVGIDMSDEMLKIAKKNHEQNFPGLDIVFQKGDGEALNIPDNSFDRVIFIGYLQHTPQRQKALDEIYRILKPGGKLVGLVSNKWNPWLSLGLRKIFAKDYGKLPEDREMSAPEVKDLAVKSGFQNIAIDIFNSLPGKTPDWLYYPLRALNLLFFIWPISLLGWHVLISGEKK